MVEEDLGVHLQCILYIPGIPKEAISLDGDTVIDRIGFYVIGHRLTQALKRDNNPNVCWGSRWNHGTLAEENQQLIHLEKKLTATHSSTNHLAIVAYPVSDLNGELIGLRGDPDEDPGLDDNYYFLESPSEWGELFIKSAEIHSQGGD